MKFIKAICLLSLFCFNVHVQSLNEDNQKTSASGIFDVNYFLEKFKKLPDEERLAFAVWLNEKSDFKKDSAKKFAKERFDRYEKFVKDNDKLYEDFKRRNSNSPDFATINNSLRKSMDDAQVREEEAQSLKGLIDEIEKLDSLGKDQRSKVSALKIKLAGKVLSEISKDKFLNKLVEKGRVNFQEAMHLAIDQGNKELFEYLVQKHVLIEPIDENYYDRFIQMKSHKPVVPVATAASTK